MSLIRLLKSDLEMYFFYSGSPGRVVRFIDLYRCFFIPRCMLSSIYRLSHSMHQVGLTPVGQLMTWVAFFLYGSEINCKTQIGPYLYFPHPNGIVVGAEVIGSHAVIYHQVTIGAARIDFLAENRPIIGDNVTIGAGAKVLGKIFVPDNSLIKANQLVTKINVGSLKKCRDI